MKNKKIVGRKIEKKQNRLIQSLHVKFETTSKCFTGYQATLHNNLVEMLMFIDYINYLID